MVLQKWQILSARDISPHKWFPLEMRSYRLPNGHVIDDFSVTTLSDVSMIVPVTRDKKVILVRQFKPGIDEVVLEFPAGRIDENHADFIDLAQSELEEETGIHVEKDQLLPFATLAGFVTKGTEKVHFFLAKNCVFNSRQSMDISENIEVVQLSAEEFDKKIMSREIWAAQTIAGWFLVRMKFHDLFP